MGVEDVAKVAGQDELQVTRVPSGGGAGERLDQAEQILVRAQAAQIKNVSLAGCDSVTCQGRVRLGTGRQRPERGVGAFAHNPDSFSRQPEPGHQVAPRGLRDGHDPVGPADGGAFLERPGNAALPVREYQLGMRQRERIVDRDDDAA